MSPHNISSIGKKAFFKRLEVIDILLISTAGCFGSIPAISFLHILTNLLKHAQKIKIIIFLDTYELLNMKCQKVFAQQHKAARTVVLWQACWLPPVLSALAFAEGTGGS